MTKLIIFPSPAQPLKASFSIGAGAVFEVSYEIGLLIRKDAPRLPFTLASGVVAGMAVLYVTGLLIK